MGSGSAKAGPAGRGASCSTGRFANLRRPVFRCRSARRQCKMARPEKVAVVEEIRTKLAEADATVLTEYRGLTVHELADAARRRCARSGTEYKVFKNTLARRAVADSGLDELVADVRRPGRHRLRAGRRGRRGQGAARLRPQQPGARPEGRPARRAGHHRGRDRSARRAAVPRRAPRARSRARSRRRW